MSREMRVSATDRKMFDRAVEAAYFGEHERVRVGAVLAKGRMLHRVRHNRVASWVEGAPWKPGHAERQVIQGMPAIKSTLYVARIQLNDTIAPSWPCGECMTHIVACSCVSKIVYWNGEEIRKVRL